MANNIPRVVIPGIPHQVCQRGARRMAVFRDDDDRREYIQLLREQSRRFGLRFLAWCVMANQVHLIAVPKRKDSLARTLGEAHRLYTRMVNARQGVRGHLFQERFRSYPMQPDECLLAAARYVELRPVMTRLVKRPGDWKWSSARFHLGRPGYDPLVKDRTLLRLARDWRGFLRAGITPEEERAVERHLSTGRPWGTARFVAAMEALLGRKLAPSVGGWPKGRKRDGVRGEMI